MKITGRICRYKPASRQKRSEIIFYRQNESYSKFPLKCGVWREERSDKSDVKYAIRPIRYDLKSEFYFCRKKPASRVWCPFSKCCSYVHECSIPVVLQKLPRLSDTHFSQVLNKLEKIFFHDFIKYHLALHFI